jgi:hypothetical protein
MYRKPSFFMCGWTKNQVKIHKHKQFLGALLLNNPIPGRRAERADGTGGAAFLPFQQIVDRSHENQFTYIEHHHSGSQFKNNLLLELPGFDVFPRPLSDV